MYLEVLVDNLDIWVVITFFYLVLGKLCYFYVIIVIF